MDECQTDKSEEECGSDEPEDNEEEGELQNRGLTKGSDEEKEAVSSQLDFLDVSQINCKKKGNRGQKPNGTQKDPLQKHVTQDRPSINPTDIDKTLENILSNETCLSEVNLNNIENISQQVLVSFADALISNTHVEVFSLANTHADDQVALALAKMLKKNCSITNLNVESNFISGKGILALIGSLQHNSTLVELRFHNQRHICGGQVEMEMAKLLRDNITLLKLGYHFELPGPRMTATAILTCNQDRQRQKRQQQRRQKNYLERNEEQSKTWDAVDNTQPIEISIDIAQGKKHLLFSQLPQSQPNGLKNVPTRKIAQMVKEQKETELDSVGPPQANTNKNLLQGEKTALLRRKDDNLGGNHMSTHDDLLAAIRGSSIGTLRRVNGHNFS